MNNRKRAGRSGCGQHSLRALMLLGVFAGAAAVWAQEFVPYRVEGGAIAEPLAERGDPARGKLIVLSRDSNCILCHAVPDSGTRFMGDLGPPLTGAAARLTEAQLRLRIVDSLRLNPDTIMPSYFRVDGLNRVAPQYRGRPVLTARQIEDVVAYLLTLH